MERTLKLVLYECPHFSVTQQLDKNNACAAIFTNDIIPQDSDKHLLHEVLFTDQIDYVDEVAGICPWCQKDLQDPSDRKWKKTISLAALDLHRRVRGAADVYAKLGCQYHQTEFHVRAQVLRHHADNEDIKLMNNHFAVESRSWEHDPALDSWRLLLSMVANVQKATSQPSAAWQTKVAQDACRELGGARSLAVQIQQTLLNLHSAIKILRAAQKALNVARREERQARQDAKLSRTKPFAADPSVKPKRTRDPSRNAMSFFAAPSALRTESIAAGQRFRNAERQISIDRLLKEAAFRRWKARMDGFEKAFV